MKRVRINGMSAKRRKIVKHRRQVVAEMFKERGLLCEMQTPVCTNMADAAHEMVGRAQGGSIVDKRNMLLSCNPCNVWVEDHPHKARDMRLKVPRWDAVEGIGGLIPERNVGG